MFRTILLLVVAFDVILLSLQFPHPFTSLVPFTFARTHCHFRLCTMSYSAGKFYSSIHHDKMMVYIVVVVACSLLSLHKHITVADFTSLFFCYFFYYSVLSHLLLLFLPCCYCWLSFVCRCCFLLLALLRSRSCGCSLVSLLRYLSIWSEKTFSPFCVSWFFRSLIRFACLLSWFHFYSSSLASEWDTFLFCLPSLMMFAIYYIKIHCCCSQTSSFLWNSATTAPSLQQPPSPTTITECVQTECGRATSRYMCVCLFDGYRLVWGSRYRLILHAPTKLILPSYERQCADCQICHAHTVEMMNQKWWFQTR